MLTELTGKCVDADTRIREEMTMTLRDDFEVPSDDLTEEEMEALYSQKAIRRADNIKKNKKKPKSDEEEKAELEDQKCRVAEVLVQNMIKSRIDRAEKKIQLLKTEWMMDNHMTMDSNMFDQLNRKVSI
jgi:hypothetical protein